MAQQFQLEKIRGTVFLPRIPFNWAFVKPLLSTLVDYVPTVYGSPHVEDNVVYNPGDWALVSPDGSKRLIFQAQKVDYIIRLLDGYSQDRVTEFVDNCRNAFEIIMDYQKKPATRLAIAPSFICPQPFMGTKGFLHKIYAESKTSFEGSQIDNCDFSQVFRLNEKINEQEVLVNFLSKFYNDNALLFNEKGESTPSLITKADFDINTLPRPDLAFTLDAMRDFFLKAPSFCDSFYKFYFAE